MRIWCAWLMALFLVLTGSAAAAEPTYEALCSDAGLTESDVCAWLEIPGSGLLLPVMQHAQDVSFYLNHDSSGQENASGALYTEVTYNARDFSDPVTVIYGKRRNDGSMFGSLQEWYSGAFDANSTIRLYLPDETREYTAFAAVPYSGIHLLYYHNFQNERIYRSFFEDVYSTRKIGVQLKNELKPEPGDGVIILSTSLKGDAAQRYLVMAKQNKLESN